jgi:predicted enzyme involved in methoxymalonyl-ACP biosynthesis
VFDRIASLERELSYIEALRDRCGAVMMIQSRIAQVGKVYKNDRQVQDEIQRMSRLMRNPLGKYEDIFSQIDGQMTDVISTLNTFNAQIAFIRQARDELHQSTMLFDELIEAWKTVRMERVPETEAMLKRTYQFLAQNFLTTQVWKRDQQ